MLTRESEFGIINESLERAATQREKTSEENEKKFLTKKTRCDILNELSSESETAQRTLKIEQRYEKILIHELRCSVNNFEKSTTQY